jgi:alkylation response protein AidB-like acyl-CoA dehydrogenase
MTATVETNPALTREEMVERVRALGPAFAERAVRYDRDASFPYENFADLREAGLLALCVPSDAGGLGASFADYARVSAEIGRYCGATALTFNMHNATMLWAGQVSDMLDFTAEERAVHHARRAELFRGVVEDGTIHSQPFSEGISAGATSGVHTKAEPVDGGFRVTGRKIFASLSGAAHR